MSILARAACDTAVASRPVQFTLVLYAYPIFRFGYARRAANSTFADRPHAGVAAARCRTEGRPAGGRALAAPAPRFSVANLRACSAQTLRSKSTGDVLRDNLILNKWEFAQGITVLKSYPWRLSVPFVLCNAQCEFCAAWTIKGNIPLDDLMTALIPVIRRCWQLDLVGWGEPLIHLQFASVLETLKREADRRARLALTTNGTRLAEWIDRLLDANVMEYAVSIHAATAATDGARPARFRSGQTGGPAAHGEKGRLSAAGRHAGAGGHAPEPRRDSGIHRVERATGRGPGASSHADVDGEPARGVRLSPPAAIPPSEFERLRDAALAAIEGAPLRAKADPATWSKPLFPPEWETRLDSLPVTPRHGRKYYRMSEIDWDALGAGEASDTTEPCRSDDNPYLRSAPLYCPSPYTAFYVNGTDRRVIPCVYMHKVPGHEFIHFKPSMSFPEVWNSPAMVAVRRSL